MAWITTILGLLGPFLAQCQQRNNPQQTTEEAQAELRKKYDAETGAFDRPTVRAVIPQVRRAEKKARREATRQERRDTPRLSTTQAYELAETKLKEAMNADQPTLAAAYTAAANLGEDD